MSARVEPRAKRAALERILREAGSLLVAYSGGVDSACLAVFAHRVLGARALAVTADSESLAGEQRELALGVARRFGFAHRVVRTAEMLNPLYVRNHADRCYHCKSELFRHLLPLARGGGLRARRLRPDRRRPLRFPPRPARRDRGGGARAARGGRPHEGGRARPLARARAAHGRASRLALPRLAPAVRHARDGRGARPRGARRGRPARPRLPRAARPAPGRERARRDRAARAAAARGAEGRARPCSRRCARPATRRSRSTRRATGAGGSTRRCAVVAVVGGSGEGI